MPASSENLSFESIGRQYIIGLVVVALLSLVLLLVAQGVQSKYQRYVYLQDLANEQEMYANQNWILSTLMTNSEGRNINDLRRQLRLSLQQLEKANLRMLYGESMTPIPKEKLPRVIQEIFYDGPQPIMPRLKRHIEGVEKLLISIAEDKEKTTEFIEYEIRPVLDVLSLMNDRLLQESQDRQGVGVHLAWLLFASILMVLLLQALFVFRPMTRGFVAERREASRVREYLEKQVAERKRSERRALENEDRLQAVFTNMTDGMITIDAEGKVEDINPKAEEMFGYNGSEVIGRNVKMLMPEPYHSEHDQYLKRYAETGQGRVIGQDSFEVSGLKKNGEAFPLELSVSEVNTGETHMFTGMVRDITERKEIEQALMDAIQSAEKANRAKSDFLAVMSHEIRTPMNGVLGMSGLMADTALNEEQKGYLKSIRDSGESLLNVINDILDFSKLEAGKFDLEAISFDVVELIESVAELVAPQAYAKDVEVIVDIDGNVPSSLRCDAGRLRQVMTNLMGNAVKFTESGSITTHVRVIEEDGSRAKIRMEVIDTGIGISTEGVKHLFRDFFQVDSSIARKYGGTGLGLAICKKIVQLMGGDIFVESQEGQGSRFWFEVWMESSGQLLEGLRSDHAKKLGGLNVAILKVGAKESLYCDLLGKYNVGYTISPSLTDMLIMLEQSEGEESPVNVLIVDDKPNELDMKRFLEERENPKHILSKIHILLGGNIAHRDKDSVLEEMTAYTDVVKPIREVDFVRTLSEVAAFIEGEKEPQRRQDVVQQEGEKPQSYPLKGVRILLAEDMPVNQKYAVSLLGKWGCQVDAVSNGIEALEMVRKIPYDVVLMDVQMPEMDGLEATRKIRQLGEPFSKIPIIAMTANAFKQDRERCIEAGMNDYVSKPVNPENLKTALMVWVDVKEESEAEEVVEELSTETPLNEDLEKEAEAIIASHEPLVDESVKVVDQSVLDSMEEAVEREGMVELIKTYFGSAQNTIATLLHDEGTGGDIEELCRMAHSLKGESGTVGLMRMFELCKKIEFSYREGEFEKAREMSNELPELFDRSRQELLIIYNELK